MTGMTCSTFQNLNEKTSTFDNKKQSIKYQQHDKKIKNQSKGLL